MSSTHPVLHVLHNAGLAAWFGGSLMGATGLNGAAAQLDDPRQRARAATAGWSRWAPVNAVAIGAHLVGAVGLLRTEWPRVQHQEGVARSSAVKTALTAGAVGAGAWSAVLNRRMAAAGDVPVAGATEASGATPPDVATTLRQLKAVQWILPALTGAVVVTTSWQEEQQRTAQQVPGVLAGLTRRVPRGLPTLAGVGAVALVAAKRKGRGPVVEAYPPPPVVTRHAPVTPAPVSEVHEPLRTEGQTYGGSA